MSTYLKVGIVAAAAGFVALSSAVIAASSDFSAAAQAWYQSKCLDHGPNSQNAPTCYAIAKLGEHDTQLTQQSTDISSLDTRVTNFESATSGGYVLGSWTHVGNALGYNEGPVAINFVTPPTTGITTKTFVPENGYLKKVVFQCVNCHVTGGAASLKAKLNGTALPIAATLNSTASKEFAVGVAATPVAVSTGDAVELVYQQTNATTDTGILGVNGSVFISAMP